MPFWEKWFQRQAPAVIPGNIKDLTPGRPLRGASMRQYTKLVPRSAESQYNPVDLLETMASYNPDASMAVWNFLRMVNPGYTLKVVNALDRSEADEDGLKMLSARTDDQFGDYGRDYGGGLDGLIDVLLLTSLTQGALAGELELSENLKDVLDWCPVDPRVVTFDTDDKTGHYHPNVYIQGIEVSASQSQFRYIPLDPYIENPYGRAPLWPLLESVYFQTEVLRDLKMVAHTTGHPRLHVEVVEEIATQHVPAVLKQPGREDDLRVWMDGWLTEIADAYKTLQADDAFFTWDWINVNQVSGGKASYDLSALVKVVEQQVIASLKHLPILLGRIEGSGLAHGTVQWQIFAETIMAMRRHVTSLVGWWGTQTLRIWGRPSLCIIEFPEIRTQDRLREAQGEAAELANAITMFKLGWVTNEELAQKFVGHDPVGEPMIEEVGTSPGPAESPSEPAEEPASDEEAGAGGGRRAFSELDYAQHLPKWMRSRVGALEGSLKAATSVHRLEVFDELISEGNGNDNSNNGR